MKNGEIVRYITQTGLFKPVNASKIVREENSRWRTTTYNYLFVSTKSSKTCTQLKEIIRTLEKSPIVAYASLSLCDTYQCLEFLSFPNYFYVVVKDPDDLVDLHAVVQETNTRIIGQYIWPEWFFVETNKKSKVNSLKMANYFHETGKFTRAMPDFVQSRPWR